MCTATTYQTKDFYFGRNLDYEFGYGETVTFTPRHYPFQLNGLGVLDQHYAILGMACVQNNYPLYYDAINEKGLCIAGLNFVGNAWYCKDEPGKDNVAQFELIPWLLGRCATVQDARTLLDRMNLVDTPFCEGMPVASLLTKHLGYKICKTVLSAFLIRFELLYQSCAVFLAHLVDGIWCLGTFLRALLVNRIFLCLCRSLLLGCLRSLCSYTIIRNGFTCSLHTCHCIYCHSHVLLLLP